MKQLSFFDDFAAAADEAASAHLPSCIEAGIPFYRTMLDRYHAAMLVADAVEAGRIGEEAHQLARHLNNGDPGILADDDASGNVLRRETAATPGDVPLWGQAGQFVIEVDGLKVRIETRGIFAIGGSAGFSAHAVSWDRPFVSSTGFRSFLGVHFEAVPGMTFDVFATEVLRDHIKRELKGKRVQIEPRYRPSAGPAETLDAG